MIIKNASSITATAFTCPQLTPFTIVHKPLSPVAMTNPSPTLASLSRRLTSTSQLLLERSRVISLNIAPSASSTNTIVRNLTAIKRDLQQIEDELDKNGLRSKGKKGESEVEKQVREVGASYDRLVEMLSEDEAGRGKAQNLVRE
jgi:syntaxin 8